MKDIALIILCALSSIVFRYLTAFLIKKSTPRMQVLQNYMPLMIIVALVALLYRGLDYSHAPFALDYLAAGIIAIIICAVTKKSVLAIVIATISFVLMHDYLLKGFYE